MHKTRCTIVFGKVIARPQEIKIYLGPGNFVGTVYQRKVPRRVLG